MAGRNPNHQLMVNILVVRIFAIHSIADGSGDRVRVAGCLSVSAMNMLEAFNQSLGVNHSKATWF